MLVLSQRNIIIPHENGAVALHRGVVEEVPDYVASSTYFKGLVRVGKITIPKSSRDRDVQAAAEKPVKTRRPKADS